MASERSGPLNRARGLRLDELGRRYLRRHEREGARLAREIATGAWTQVWGADEAGEGGSECWGADDCCYGQGTTERLTGLTVRLVAYLHRPRLGERLRGLGGRAVAAPVREPPRREPRELEAAVAEHLGWLRRLPPTESPCWDARLRAAFADEGLDERAAGLLREIARAQGAALTALFLFAPLWRRPLASWRPAPKLRGQKVLESLVKHLLCEFPVPAPLLRAFAKQRGPALKWVAWTVLVGQGGSLVRAARRCGFVVSAAVQHQLGLAPRQLGPRRACVWAAARALGAGDLELRWLDGHGGYGVDPTGDADAFEPRWDDEVYGEPDDEAQARVALWRETLLFLVRQRAALQGLAAEEVQLILDHGLHLHTEARRLGPAPFSWAGRSVRALLAAAEERRRVQLTPHAALAWPGRGWDWQEEGVAADSAFRVTELTTGQALYDEGQALRHCVGLYAPACNAGRSAIFSMTRGDARRATIEIDPATGAVRQAHGACNRPLLPDEARVLAAWRASCIVPALLRPPAG